MFVGKVIGTVWSTVKWPELSGHKLLLVRPYHLAELEARQNVPAIDGLPQDNNDDNNENSSKDMNEAVVCVDMLDAGVGDDVVVAFGHAARVAIERLAKAQGKAQGKELNGRAPSSPKTTTPIDAAVVAVVDSFHINPHA